MSIRNKILWSFSVTTILLVAVAFSFTYWLFSAYREEAFQQQQNQKIHVTAKLINRFKEESEKIAFILDAQDINDFYDEKLLVFDKDKTLIFSSLDDLDIRKRNSILNALSPAHRWIETREGAYDLIGVYLESNGKSYYAISKAYDALGYDKLHFLRKVLILLFIAIVIIVLFISVYLANNLSGPINHLTFLLRRYDFNKEPYEPLVNKTATKEIKYLTEHFNALLLRAREAFTFQKNTVAHISHQLKTPVAVLVSELEHLQQQVTDPSLKAQIDQQILRAKSLGDIISTLLEIARIESGKNFNMQTVRADELLFELLEQSNERYPGFHFQLTFIPESFTEQQMEMYGNELLLKQALQNLLYNSILYAEDNRACITIDGASPQKLKITIANTGVPLREEEKKFLFNYFFRGKNSAGKSGSGLGLVLAQKIIHYHRGKITYSGAGSTNSFEVEINR